MLKIIYSVRFMQVVPRPKQAQRALQSQIPGRKQLATRPRCHPLTLRPPNAGLHRPQELLLQVCCCP